MSGSASRRRSGSGRLAARDIIPDGGIINKCVFADNVRLRK